jgi:hypothetical protein
MKTTNFVGLLAITFLIVGGLLSGQALGQTKTPSGYTLEDFQLKSAGDLYDICTLPSSNPDHAVARAFCYGFIEGAAHYDDALEAGSKVAIVCTPASTTREQVVTQFVTYMQANPQYRTDRPVDAVFRAIIAKWPCP